jgi:hypothetical protein
MALKLKDALKSPPPVRTGMKSRIDVWRDALDPEDREALDTALLNEEWTTSAIHEIAKKDGLDIQGAAFRAWRKRFQEERA